VNFIGRYTFLGEFRTNTPHVPGMTRSPGPVGPTGAADRARWHVSSPRHPHSLKHNLDE
jgi:hypothetical protein